LKVEVGLHIVWRSDAAVLIWFPLWCGELSFSGELNTSTR